MTGITPTQTFALCPAFALAITATALVQQADAWFGDLCGLVLVLAGVYVAALTKVESAAE